MKLTLGKKYITREGRKTSPLTKSRDDTNYKFAAFVEGFGAENDDYLAWREDGKYLFEFKENRNDLVAECED